jgi:hypothetical protein
VAQRSRNLRLSIWYWPGDARNRLVVPLNRRAARCRFRADSTGADQRTLLLRNTVHASSLKSYAGSDRSRSACCRPVHAGCSGSASRDTSVGRNECARTCSEFGDERRDGAGRRSEWRSGAACFERSERNRGCKSGCCDTGCVLNEQRSKPPISTGGDEAGAS